MIVSSVSSKKKFSLIYIYMVDQKDDCAILMDIMMNISDGHNGSV